MAKLIVTRLLKNEHLVNFINVVIMLVIGEIRWLDKCENKNDNMDLKMFTSKKSVDLLKT